MLMLANASVGQGAVCSSQSFHARKYRTCTRSLKLGGGLGGEQDPIRAVLLSEGTDALPPLVEVLVTLREHSVRLVKPPGVDELWQWYEQKGHLEGDPSWGKIWETSRALAAYILCGEGLELDGIKVDMRGKRIAEVGCGLGLAGLTAALFADCKSVTFCDREALAIHCALSSAAINSIEVVACSDIGTSNGVEVAGALLDWAEPQAITHAVDVVIGADCLYDPDTAALLAQACSALLRNSGQVILCEPSTERALGCRAAFLHSALQTGASKADVISLPSSEEDDASCVLVVVSW